MSVVASVYEYPDDYDINPDQLPLGWVTKNINNLNSTLHSVLKKTTLYTELHDISTQMLQEVLNQGIFLQYLYDLDKYFGDVTEFDSRA